MNHKNSVTRNMEIDFSEQLKAAKKGKAPALASKIEVKAENDGKGEMIQTMMLQMQKQYQIFHWQTTSFSQHKSFGKIYESLDESIDTFIETYMGKYGRVISASKFNLEMSNYSDLNFISATDSYIEFLINLTNMLDSNRDTDLLNTRDEVLGSLNRLKYLLTLS